MQDRTIARASLETVRQGLPSHPTSNSVGHCQKEIMGCQLPAVPGSMDMVNGPSLIAFGDRKKCDMAAKTLDGQPQLE